MNEILEELAAEAEIYADSVVELGGEFHLAYTKKLAELIVKECAQLADDCPADYLSQPYKYPSTYIKEYFGV